MKTITLTEEAYTRLKDWKSGAQDSFSNVVLRVVPKHGTLADMIEGFKQLPPLTEPQAQIMTEAVAWANDWNTMDEGQEPWPAGSEPAPGRDER